MTWLPVSEDEDEAEYVYGYLCDLIEANHPTVLGPNNNNLPKLISIIAEAFLRDGISIENAVAKRMVNIVQQVQVNVNFNIT